MSWKDFFYFAKGERRALVVLLVLISSTWLVLMRSDKYRASQPTFYPVCIYNPNHEAPVTPSLPEENTAPPLPETSKPAEKEKPAKKPFYQKEPAYVRQEKYPPGTLVELNTADTVSLKKVPGIGSSFSRRIVKYRELLGGFYAVEQLAEVYGIDAERYELLKGWFCVNTNLVRRQAINRISVDSLARHPYITYRQARAIGHLCKQKGKLTGWENLTLLEEFPESDRQRLAWYISFE